MKETVTDMWNSERVGASRGPEMRGSEPSALPHLTELTTEIAAGDKCSPPVLVADSLGLGLPLGLRREVMLTWLWLLLKGVLLRTVRRG